MRNAKNWVMSVNVCGYDLSDKPPNNLRNTGIANASGNQVRCYKVRVMVGGDDAFSILQTRSGLVHKTWTSGGEG